MNWGTRKLTVLCGSYVSSGAGQTEVLGGSLPQARTIPRPELPAAKLTIRRSPEGVKISKGGARLLASREFSVASNLCATGIENSVHSMTAIGQLAPIAATGRFR